MSQYTDTLSQIMSHGENEGLTHRFVENESLNGKMVSIGGRDMINFGSCSYLGLEYHPRLVEGAIEGAKRFGTQFSSSKTYACLGLYEQVETKLEKMFGKQVLVSASTTLGHLATIPVIVEDGDAVILDMQVHSSIQMTTQMLKARGIKMAVIRHNDMEALEKKIVELKTKHDKIWYFADGVYSMYGDFAPFEDLKRMLDKHQQFHLYIDDAHGASWAGKNGVGVVRAHMEHHDRMVLAVSLNKSFAAAGGCIVFPNDEMYQKVRYCGGTLIFAGPIQPPMLSALNASIDLHCSDEIVERQEALMELVDYCNDALDAAGVPQFQKTDSPLFFIPVGKVGTCIRMIQRIHTEDIFVNTASFPATPMKRGGIRFMVTGHHTKQDIDKLVAAIVKHYADTLADEGLTCKNVVKAFRIPEFNLERQVAAEVKTESHGLSFEIKRSIMEMNQEEWDALYKNRGNMDVATLKMLEETFVGNEKAHENWDFHYFIARDQKNQVVCSAFFTSLITKDDMFAPAETSIKVEEIRKEDPAYLTSRTIMLGSLMNKGQAMILDREHQEWKPALRSLIEQMQAVLEKENATQIMMGEFTGERDKELEAFFLECGLTQMALPDTNMLSGMSWKNQDEYISSTIKGRYRNDFRREILKLSGEFDVVYQKPMLKIEVDHLYKLYENVFEKSYSMNVHKLPRSFFEAAFRNPNYDVIQLKMKGQREAVAFLISHKDSEHYTALIVGLDYDYVRSHGTYKQILYRSVWRAWELGCQKLDLAYTADQVKKKIGAKQIPAYAFVQSTDHFNHIQLSVM